MAVTSLATSSRLRFRRECNDGSQSIEISIFVRPENSSSMINGDFLWFQLFVEVLLRMIDDEKAKQELIDRSLLEYQNDTVEQRKIHEFASNYISSDAIKWYTRDSFVYRMVNKALRQQDLGTLYAFRRLIIDIHQQLQNLHKQATSTQLIQHFYRGQLLSHQELDQFQQNIGNFVSMNSFLSTSIDRQMAAAFVGEQDDLCNVLFDLRVNPKLSGTKPFADVTLLSYYRDEEEVLFMLGAIFRICAVTFDSQVNIWTIELELCNDDNNELKPSFDSLKENIDDETNLYELGRIFWNMKHLDASERCFKELLQQQHSNVHIIPGCYLHLGNIATDRGQYNEAVAYHRHALELKQQVLPNDHPHLPYSENSLGEALRQSGKFDEALIHYQKALNLWRQQYNGGDRENVAMCLHNIGTIHGERDELAEALTCFLQALQIMDRCLPNIHPKIARTLKNIGSVFGLLGQIEPALRAFKRALAIQRQCLPSNHQDLADTLRDIGIYYVNTGDLSQALNYYEQARFILEQTLTISHPSYVQIQSDIAEVQLALATSSISGN
ncbi:unnamed protein product [Rotaria socialis]|uniref:NAD(P)(+)--arginine ADP-ribosyltransferase n=1 Tax=Rotaria socialis TaxID=392032 RepID=A0A820WNB7_9BILA|nr:unnamed protein product [Rotaria socialis]CAF3768618.1 unnamed protein product [Rotaria socialis]CAF4294290.1 unnamed protein product [Rotaria socialis]CAF4517161.1 unnamed protein product [Rotaria socialis]